MKKNCIAYFDVYKVLNILRDIVKNTPIALDVDFSNMSISFGTDNVITFIEPSLNDDELDITHTLMITDSNTSVFNYLHNKSLYSICVNSHNKYCDEEVYTDNTEDGIIYAIFKMIETFFSENDPDVKDLCPVLIRAAFSPYGAFDKRYNEVPMEDYFSVRVEYNK